MSDERSDQTEKTRRLLMSTAERLFAADGISAVSNRQVSKEAGQGNNYAVGHHFGGRQGLLEAILDAHDQRLQVLRTAAVDEVDDAAEFRDWVRCLVSPQFEYIAELTAPSYFARYCAQLDGDPTAAQTLYVTMGRSAPLLTILDGFYASLPPLPDLVITVRDSMTRHLIIQQLADFERALDDAAATGSAAPGWCEYRDIVVDALVGLWLAPVTAVGEPGS